MCECVRESVSLSVCVCVCVVCVRERERERERDRVCVLGVCVFECGVCECVVWCVCVYVCV